MAAFMRSVVLCIMEGNPSLSKSFAYNPAK